MHLADAGAYHEFRLLREAEMKFFSFHALGIVCLALFSTVGPNNVAMAQVPGGSYTQTCQDISVNQRTLVARCKDRSGALKLVILPEFPACVGEVVNDNGQLRCDFYRHPPDGSYKQSCEVTTVDLRRGLKSTCKDRSGRWRETYLGEFESCQGDIFNDDGVLRCNRTTAINGSYSQTCENIYLQGDTLHGTCRKLDGKLIKTELGSVSQCQGEVANVNGALTCYKGSANLPAGSFSQTCINLVLSGATLTGDCVNLNGVFTKSTLEVADCRSGVSNIDGVLSCEKGTAAAPKGSYKETCRNIVVSGSLVKAQCRQRNGSYTDAEIDFATCGTVAIRNVDGKLACSTTGASSVIPPERKEICSGDPIAAGWAIVDTKWDPTICGRPSSVSANVYILRKYDAMPVGTIFRICSGQTWLNNWQQTQTSWDPTKCGRPSSPSNNMTDIQRKF
jgi:hypothetical protein